MTLEEFGGKRPRVHSSAFVHPSAVLIGDVTVGEGSSVWPGAVIRGDVASVKIGRYTCVQDNAVIHPGEVYAGRRIEYIPVKVGDYVTIAHNALLHGCTVEDNCLIGGGAVIFNNAKIRKGAIIGMGAVVLEGVEVPPNTIFVGIPARRLRELKKNELGKTLRHAKEHARLAKLYLKRHKAGTKEG